MDSPEKVLSTPLPLKQRLGFVLAAAALGILLQIGVRQWSNPIPSLASSSLTTVAPSGAATAETPTDAALRFYASRVQRDPEDTRAQNALAELYLQQVRETGNEDYLPLAIAAAQKSLATVPAARNLGGLIALAHGEFANHAFQAAREHARQLLEFQPSKSEPFAILGDASVELGDYEEAALAYEKMRELAEDNPGTETRLGRLALLRGAPQDAARHFSNAITLLQQWPHPPEDTIAWCHWQLGETAFSLGEYEGAEKHLRAALKVVPDYFRALGSMGRLKAAQGNLEGALTHYEEAVRIAPSIAFMATLGDLYQFAGRKQDASVRYELAEQLGEHSRKVHGVPYDRQLALFLADHDLQPDQAYRLAREEYAAGRHDVYGADALGWSALKAGQVEEAQKFMKEALRLGTRDARLYYHAGLVAQAAGDRAGAISFLERALALNPGFDPKQSALAKQSLARLKP